MLLNKVILLIFSFSFLIFNYKVNGDDQLQLIENQQPKIKESSLQPYLLPSHHKLQKKLKKIFQDPKIFDGASQMQNAGLTVLSRVHRGLMVAKHPSLKKYLIKKFINDVPRQEQLENYLRRIKGARALYSLIVPNKLEQIVVPKKWLYPLPQQFADPKTNETTYVLVVEKLNLCSGMKDPNGEIANHYRIIEKDQLRELCLVLYHFHGLDSMMHNMPFTLDGKIAFVDTERWESVRKGFLIHILPYLNSERQDFVYTQFQKLRSGR